MRKRSRLHGKLKVQTNLSNINLHIGQEQICSKKALNMIHKALNMIHKALNMIICDY